MNDFINVQIKKAIFELLKEQSEEQEKTDDKKPEKKKASSAGVISTSGAFGSGGRARSFVTSAKARAQEDPEGLMSDLGITKASSSGDDLDAALSVLSTAISANVVMNEAYTGARMTTDTVDADKDQRNLTVVAVGLNKLDRKNGIRFLAHTLIAAQNANIMNLRGGLQFARGRNNSIIIYSI